MEPRGETDFRVAWKSSFRLGYGSSLSATCTEEDGWMGAASVHSHQCTGKLLPFLLPISRLVTYTVVKF